MAVDAFVAAGAGGGGGCVVVVGGGAVRRKAREEGVVLVMVVDGERRDWSCVFSRAVLACFCLRARCSFAVSWSLRRRWRRDSGVDVVVVGEEGGSFRFCVVVLVFMWLLLWGMRTKNGDRGKGRGGRMGTCRCIPRSDLI